MGEIKASEYNMKEPCLDCGMAGGQRVESAGQSRERERAQGTWQTQEGFDCSRRIQLVLCIQYFKRYAQNKLLRFTVNGSCAIYDFAANIQILVLS